MLKKLLGLFGASEPKQPVEEKKVEVTQEVTPAPVVEEKPMPAVMTAPKKTRGPKKPSKPAPGKPATKPGKAKSTKKK